MDKLDEILAHYQDTYGLSEEASDIKEDLIRHNVEVRGDSYYCPVWEDSINSWVLLAGTKDKADVWVLKRIIKLIKTGDPIVSMLNGNSDYLLDKLSRYNVKVISRDKDISFISFNK